MYFIISKLKIKWANLLTLNTYFSKTHHNKLPYFLVHFLYEIINKLHFAPRSLFVRHFHWANNSETDKKQSLCCPCAYLYSKYNMLWQSFQRLPLHKALTLSKSQGCGARTVLQKISEKTKRTDNCLAKLNQAHKPPTVQNWGSGGGKPTCGTPSDSRFFPLLLLSIGFISSMNKFP